MHWTQDDVEFLLTATKTGWTAKEVAQELGRSEKAVLAKRAGLGLCGKSGRPKKYTREELIAALQTSPVKTYDYFNSAENNTPAATTYRSYFGTWEAALEAAGVSSNASTMKSHLPTRVYLVDFGDFYKIGITQQTVHQRLGSRYPAYKILLEIETTLDEARAIEKAWLESVKPYSFVPDNFPEEGRGFTECFQFSA
jgi:hypothetical protein